MRLLAVFVLTLTLSSVSTAQDASEGLEGSGAQPENREAAIENMGAQMARLLERQKEQVRDLDAFQAAHETWQEHHIRLNEARASGDTEGLPRLLAQEQEARSLLLSNAQGFEVHHAMVGQAIGEYKASLEALDSDQ